MGNSQSNRTFFKLHAVMPPTNRHGENNPLTGWLDKSTKPFVSDEDRKQFIYATITVITENGAIDLSAHDFRLLYSRRSADADRLVARLVAEKEGVIRTQVVAEKDGKNQIEAFLALRRHIETQLDGILSGLSTATASGSISPYQDRNQDGGSLSTTRQSGSGSSGAVRQPTSPAASDPQGRNGHIALPSDAPPSYGKAVKDWKAEEKKT